jgi:hypothetical protein
MSTREFLVQFGPGVILVQLKDGIQVPCGFLGSAGTITHLISPGPWPKVGQIWYGLDAYDPYLSPVPISFQKIARGGHRARRRSPENLKLFQENKKTSDPSKVELYNRRTRSQQAIHALKLMSRWYLVTGGLHASPRVARSAPPTT